MQTLPVIISCVSVLAVVVFGLLMWARLKDLAGKTDSPAIQIMQQQVEALREQTQQRLDNMNTSLLNTMAALRESMNKQTSAVTGSLNKQLTSINTSVAQRIDQQSKIFADFKERIGIVETLGKNLGELSKEISNFQQILRAPQLRGEMGEFMLEELLGQTLPADHYDMQFTFSGNEKVDAIIRLKNGIVPVDAKFPLDNFRKMMSLEEGSDERKHARRNFAKDVMRHIDDIATKYIRPVEGTLDFALMYIPAENVYYETIVKEAPTSRGGTGIPAYAMSKHVMPVSPNSFWAYLQVIAMGLKGLRLEERVHEVMAHLGGLGKDVEAFSGEFETLGKHIRNSHNKYEEAASKFSRMSTRLQQIAEVPAVEDAVRAGQLEERPQPATPIQPSTSESNGADDR
jgi:DNA recombination protein RmuC